MDKIAELKQEISALGVEMDKYYNAGDTKNAFPIANKINAKYEELRIEQAKEKARFDNFLDNMRTGNVYNIQPDCYEPLAQNSGKIRSYSDSQTHYKKEFINSLRHNFQNASQVLIEGQDTNGGYTVPTELSDEISTMLEEENVLRKIGKVVQVASRHAIPIVTNAPVANWIGETQKIEISDEEFSQIVFQAKKLAVSIRISNELLSDSNYDLESHFVDQFTKAIGRLEEDTLLNNATTDTDIAPTGLLTELKADSDAQVLTATADAKFTGDDIINLIYSIPRAYRKNASILTADSTLQKIRQLKNANLDYIWQPSTREGEPDRLFGHPVYTSPYFPAATQRHDILAVFGDFNYYMIAQRQDRIFRALRELYALEDISAFLMIERLDAKIVDKHAFKYLELA